MRVLFCIGCLAALLIAGPARADEELEKLRGEFEEAQQKWFEALQAAQGGTSTPPDLSKLPPHPAREFLPRFREYAEKHPGSSGAAEALGMVVAMAGMAPGEAPPHPAAVWAIERLTQQHAADPAIREVLRNLRYAEWVVGRKPLEALYEKVAHENKDRETVATAKFNHAALIYEDRLRSEGAATQPADSRDACALFREIVKDYGDTDAARKAEGFVFELENLQIGMLAPDFEGEDAEGNRIRLSQFRGQVVVLDFWGFW
jgi:hypothetical protein